MTVAHVQDDTHVIAWQADRFLEAANAHGLEMDAHQALAAAELGVDWHDFESLLRRGCGLETALRILAPVVVARA